MQLSVQSSCLSSYATAHLEAFLCACVAQETKTNNAEESFCAVVSLSCFPDGNAYLISWDDDSSRFLWNAAVKS